MTTKSPSAAGRSTPTSVPKRSRRASRRRGDVLVGDLDVVDRDGDAVERGDGDLGADLDLGGEVQLTLLAGGRGGQAGDLGDLDLGLAERAQLVLADGLGVEAGQALVDRVLEDGGATDALVDDARRHLALAEAGDDDVLGDVLVRVIDARLELVVRHLDGQLDLGGLQGLDGALHFDGLQLIGAGAGDSGDLRWFRAARRRPRPVKGPTTARWRPSTLRHGGRRSQASRLWDRPRSPVSDRGPRPP